MRILVANANTTEAINAQCAEAVVTGGAALAGDAARLQDAAPVPLRDGIVCAARIAETPAKAARRLLRRAVGPREHRPLEGARRAAARMKPASRSLRGAGCCPRFRACPRHPDSCAERPRAMIASA
jgi:hypothetical protein